MLNKIVFPLLALILGFNSSSIYANEKTTDDRPLLSINKITTRPTIDGKLEDNCWQQGIRVSPFILSDGKGSPYENTLAFCAYDNKNLYVAFKCYENNLNPDFGLTHKIRASRKERDNPSLWMDDCVELFIKTGPKQKDYYHFIINTIGTVLDAKNERDHNWNSSFKSAVHKTKTFWSVEMAVPFSDLDITKMPSDETWTVNFCREQKGFDENSCWAPTNGSFLNKNRWGKLVFKTGIPRITFPLSRKKIVPGTNTIPLQIKSAIPQTIKISSRLIFPKDKTVTSSRTVSLKPEQQTAVNYTFNLPAELLEKCKSKNMQFQYMLTDVDSGNVLYKSATVTQSTEKYSPFRTNIFLYDDEHDLFLAEKTAHTFRIDIQRAENLKDTTIKNLTLVIDLPDFVTLMNPLDGKRHPALNPPLKFRKKAISHNGMKYMRYYLSYPVKLLFPIGKKGNYKNQSTLVLYTAKQTTSSPTFFYYRTMAKVNGKRVSEPRRTIKLKLLPESQGKQPKKLVILEWSTAATLTNTRVTEKERKLIFDNWQKAGFNIKGLQEFGLKIYTPKQWTQMRQRGIEPMQALLTNSQNIFDRKYINMFPGADKYLAKHPQYKALNASGKRCDKIICYSHLLEKNSPYLKEMEKWTAKLANKFQYLMYDHEVPVFREYSTCFCEKCLANFDKEYKPGQKINLTNIGVAVKSAFSKKKAKKMTAAKAKLLYKKEWTDFRCKQNAQLAALLNKYIKKANPNCTLMLYSAYEKEKMHSHAGTNFKYMGKSVDAVVCGYGRPLKRMAHTKKLLDGKPLIPGELIWWRHGGKYDMNKFRVNAFRRVTDLGNIQTFQSPYVDGRFWHAMADITRLASEYEPLFTNPVSRNELVETTIDPDRVKVLANDKNERVIVVFNETNIAEKVVLKNKEIPAGAVCQNYFTGEKLKPEVVTVNVKPMNVEVITIMKK